MKYAIQDTTLTAIGDAIREYKPTKSNVIGKKVWSQGEDYNLDESIMITSSGTKTSKALIFPNAKSIRLWICATSNAYSPEHYVKIYRLYGNKKDIFATRSKFGEKEKNNPEVTIYDEILIPDCEGVYIGLSSSSSGWKAYYSIKAIGYDENGNEIMIDDIEEVENAMTPAEMVNNINNLNVIPEDLLEFTGNCFQLFSYSKMNSIIEKIGNKLKTKDISNANSMFYNNNTIEEIPFEINFDRRYSHDVEDMFWGCDALKKLPKINYLIPYRMTDMLYRCSSVEEIPDDWCDTWNWDGLQNPDANIPLRIKYVSPNFLKNLKSRTSTTVYIPVLYLVKEVIGLPVYDAKQSTTNLYKSFTFYNARKVIFDMDNGKPYEVELGKQTLDFSSGSIGNFSKYSSPTSLTEIKFEKMIKDDATYQALKDDDEAWSNKIEYSFYNHDSAVETINSLPDTSAFLATQAGMTNTIKFKGTMGSLTDGGAINTLTEEEIAVATAKGWTVSFV